MSKSNVLRIRLSGEGRALFDLVDKSKSASIADGISIRYETSYVGDSADLGPVHNFVIEIVLPIARDVAGLSSS
jgi:hypothetical protein